MKRVLLFLLLVASCAAPTQHAAPATTPPTSPPASPQSDDPATTTGKVHCGYVRWAVKTGADPLAGKVNLTPTVTTITALRAAPAPFPPPTSKYPPNYRRFPAEQRTVMVTATLIAYDIEQDNDLHLVLADSQASTIIAEIPNPACVKSGPFKAAITATRKAFVARTHYNPPAPKPGQYSPPFVTTAIPVTVTGVVFYDFVHGQNGVAPNGVELHPVLSIIFR